MAGMNPAEFFAAMQRMMAETKWTKVPKGKPRGMDPAAYEDILRGSGDVADPRAAFAEGRRDYRMAQGSTDQDQMLYEQLMGNVDENPYGPQIRASEPLPEPRFGDPGMPRQTQNYMQHRMFAGPKGALPAALIAAMLRAQQTSRPSSAPADATGY